jgi:cytochrome c oxidase cbb3-type subunit 1
MSATSSSSQPISAGVSQGPSPVAASEIDASCRCPVLSLFVHAAFWLLVASVLGMIATLKFHAPNLLAKCAWFTYGRVHPAAMDAFLYGFAAQAGLGVTLWLMAHMGRARLAFGPAIIGGGKLWNLGLLLGIIGILYGENTGYEWLELPRYALVMMFAGYILIVLGGLVTLHQSVGRQLYVTQKFMVAAWFWFPWIFSTAGILLVAKPVRGALQAAIDWWYMNNLATVWFGFIGLGAIFYFIPKITRRSFHSHYLGVLIFWTLALFGSGGGIPAGAPLPSWMSALSTAAIGLTIVPILAVAISVRKTVAGDYSQIRENRAFKFFLFATGAYVVAGLARVAASPMRISRFVEFTWFVPAQTQLFLYGFFAITMFGAIYYIVPRLLQAEFPKPGLVCFHFLLAAGGILLYAVPLAIGGISQGIALNNPDKSFIQVATSSILFLRISTTGDLLMLLGHLILLLNLAGILYRAARTSASAAWAANTKFAEVPS